MSESTFPTFTCTVSGPGYGFVYVMSYPGSDKVKIGHTLHPDMRAGNIGGTLAPEDPILEAYYWCSERREAIEAWVHAHFKKVRQNGEWFLISAKEATVGIDLAGIKLGITLKPVYENPSRKGNRKQTYVEERYVKIPGGGWVRRDLAK